MGSVDRQIDIGARMLLPPRARSINPHSIDVFPPFEEFPQGSGDGRRDAEIPGDSAHPLPASVRRRWARLENAGTARARMKADTSIAFFSS